MHPATGQLQELQRLDQRIAALQSDLAGLPKRMRDADAQLTGARTAVANAKRVHSQALTERKKYELDVEQWKGRAKKYREQSAAVKTNEAYKALQHEIANAEAEASKSEDQVLGKMMAIEEAEARVRHFEADLREAERGIAVEKKKIEEQYYDEKKKLEAAQAERALVAEKVPKDLLDLYTRISKPHPGTVMAEVRDHQCKGCGMRVLPHVIQMLKDDRDTEVFRCETCGRILYTLELIPPSTDSECADRARPAELSES
ncbi:MAG TPA: C4-type zinc ribbon domain-containing protein [Candidatus Acidoferrum sp.]|nr:C4-type zinc ribbon domain-containing protein [Candidatus Acidoferrum sp.]